MNMKGLAAVAQTVRALSMDGVQKANSGHPGMPMGCAELGALLYGELLKQDPDNPDWADRDRFVLSAGHGSMFLYSLLHLAGYDLKLDELKNFRQLHSRTAGHPEYGTIPGIETTTGPLGAGFSNAVGMAAAEKMLAARFNTAEHAIVDHNTYALSGDGCLQEGLSSEAASLAGHLGLGKLIVFYDSNRITIEGDTDLSFSEDVLQRFRAYGWQTLEGDMYDMAGTAELVAQAKADTSRPTLIKLNSTIGKGAPNLQGSHNSHGAPLGEDEIAAARKELGIPADTAFYVNPEAVAHMKSAKEKGQARHKKWLELFAAWEKENPALKDEWDRFHTGTIDGKTVNMPVYETGSKTATRAASGKALNAIAGAAPFLVGGSADLAPSNKTDIKEGGDFLKDSPAGRNMHFGIREHAMGGIVNGMVLHGGLRAFGATFLVFADYMRPALRLSALMGIPSIWVFTHDSIYVGEDGPTHQPVEHIESLRIIPNLQVLRPADGEETNAAWLTAMETTDRPTALLFSRQGLPCLKKDDPQWEDNYRKGGYIVKDCKGTPDVTILATGSEVSLAVEAAENIDGRQLRVVSIGDRRRFLSQPQAWRAKIVPPESRIMAVEAGVGSGWAALGAAPEDILSLDRFGESGPGAAVAQYLGLTADSLAAKIER